MVTLRLAAAILLMLFVAACTVTARGDFCAISRPIRLSSETVATLSDAEVAAILQHNEKGAALCRWRP